MHQPSAATIEGCSAHRPHTPMIVTRLAMDLDGAGDVALGLVDVLDRAHYHVIEHFVPGQCALDCDFGHLLDFLFNLQVAKVRMFEGLAEGRFARGRVRVAFQADGALYRRLRTTPFWLRSRSVVRE
jgi:hypothetical protein